VTAAVAIGSNVTSSGVGATEIPPAAGQYLAIRVAAGYTPSVRLLVSVRDGDEAAAALAGGADIIDAKEPAAGALGAVSLDTLSGIARIVAARRPLTAALGDGEDEGQVEALARTFVARGAHLVKLGLARCDGPRARAMLEAAARGAGAARVVAVAYADHVYAQAPAPADVLRLAAAARLAGILIDTADKQGPGLCALEGRSTIAGWVVEAKRAGLLVALAGKLAADDVIALGESDADIIGVRGAACEGGRGGRILPRRVRALVQAMPHDRRRDVESAIQSNVALSRPT
jgi:uncharacterized protein (UPF0264 family)